MTKTYFAEIGGSSWKQGDRGTFSTITAARKWAESYGTTADWCTISTRKGNVVASHRRDRNGDGTNWFKAQV